jgi:hypothetical protein
MIVDDEKIRMKIMKRQELIRQDKDVSDIDAEIKMMTERYIVNVNSGLNTIKNDTAEIRQKEQLHQKIDRKDYSMLIDLYRKAVSLTNEISAYKKQLRRMKK